jgi:hypothetical protein
MVYIAICCSCQAILDADNTAKTDTYNIQGVLTGCYMKDGKGWMLVMKIPSTNQDKFFCKPSARSNWALGTRRKRAISLLLLRL